MNRRREKREKNMHLFLSLFYLFFATVVMNTTSKSKLKGKEHYKFNARKQNKPKYFNIKSAEHGSFNGFQEHYVDK